MNLLFYNIAGGIVHQIRHKKRTTISEMIVCVKRNIKQNRNWFYFKFSVESWSLKSKLTFEGWNRPVCHLFGFTRVSFCLSFKICCISSSDSEANRDSADVRSLVFLFLPHLRTLGQEKRSAKFLCFRTGGPSLCLYPLFLWNMIFFLTLNMGAHAKKNFWWSNLLVLSACTIEILSMLMYTEFDCAALLAML